MDQAKRIERYKEDLIRRDQAVSDSYMGTVSSVIGNAAGSASDSLKRNVGVDLKETFGVQTAAEVAE